MKRERLHVADLQFQSYIMLYRPFPSQLKKAKQNGSASILYREYKFLIDNLNGEDSYSHNVGELYDRLVMLSRDPQTLKNKKLSGKIAELLHPARFMQVLTSLVNLNLILMEIGYFTKDRVVPGKYEGTYSSRTGWRPGDETGV